MDERVCMFSSDHGRVGGLSVINVVLVPHGCGHIVLNSSSLLVGRQHQVFLGYSLCQLPLCYLLSSCLVAFCHKQIVALDSLGLISDFLAFLSLLLPVDKIVAIIIVLLLDLSLLLLSSVNLDSSVLMDLSHPLLLSFHCIISLSCFFVLYCSFISNHSLKRESIISSNEFLTISLLLLEPRMLCSLSSLC